MIGGRGHIKLMEKAIDKTDPAKDAGAPADGDPQPTTGPKQKPGEIGGPKGPEPTRYGDWEVGGRCTDF